MCNWFFHLTAKIWGFYIILSNTIFRSIYKVNSLYQIQEVSSVFVILVWQIVNRDFT